MPMAGKSGTRDDPIVIDDAQAPESHVRRIMVIREREGMPAVEPALAALTARHAIAKLDHVCLLLRRSSKCAVGCSPRWAVGHRWAPRTIHPTSQPRKLPFASADGPTSRERSFGPCVTAVRQVP